MFAIFVHCCILSRTFPAERLTCGSLTIERVLEELQLLLDLRFLLVLTPWFELIAKYLTQLVKNKFDVIS